MGGAIEQPNYLRIKEKKMKQDLKKSLRPMRFLATHKNVKPMIKIPPVTPQERMIHLQTTKQNIQNGGKKPLLSPIISLRISNSLTHSIQSITFFSMKSI